MSRATPSPAPIELRPYELGRPEDPEWNLRESSWFLDGRGPVWDTLARLARRLNEEKIPYAVLGAMALNAHGHRRVTTDVDVVVTGEARRRIHELLDGRGWLPPIEGSRNLRDTMNGVRVDLILAGDFPGDGKPKPIAFPDPSAFEPFVKEDVRYVTLEQLVELKIASGISHRVRYRDLGDVISLIDSVQIPRDFGERLHEWVRPKWYEMWDDWESDPLRGLT